MARWNPQAYADGRPFELEDQDTWEARSDRFDRAYRIHQGPPVKGRKPGLAAWLSHVGPEWDSPIPRETLTIGLILTDETARLAEKLLRKWMNPETTAEEMKAYIAEHAPEQPPSAPGE